MNSNGKVRLRKKKLSDARNDYKWRTNPGLAKLDAATTLDISYAQYLSEYAFELCYHNSSRHEFAIETIEDGKHIGNCVYYNVSEDSSKAELGIMIGEQDCWDKGYGTQSINLLLARIFSETSLNRVYLTTLDWNTRAQKCFQKCEFAVCGNLVRDGYSFLVMEISRNIWQQKQDETSREQSASGKTTLPS